MPLYSGRLRDGAVLDASKLKDGMRCSLECGTTLLIGQSVRQSLAKMQAISASRKTHALKEIAAYCLGIQAFFCIFELTAVRRPSSTQVPHDGTVGRSGFLVAQIILCACVVWVVRGRRRHMKREDGRRSRAVFRMFLIVPHQWYWVSTAASRAGNAEASALRYSE